VVTTWFNGSPVFYDNGTVYVPNPDPIRYVGDPLRYPEIDDNWEKLSYGTFNYSNLLNEFGANKCYSSQGGISASLRKKPVTLGGRNTGITGWMTSAGIFQGKRQLKILWRAINNTLCSTQSGSFPHFALRGEFGPPPSTA
jgi:hypothetical protein